jgi:hypothetical protein
MIDLFALAESIPGWIAPYSTTYTMNYSTDLPQMHNWYAQNNNIAIMPV